MKTFEKRAFNEILKAERVRRGWSQQFVAEKLDTDFRVVSRWERGRHLPTPYFRPKLCELFNMSLEELGLLKSLPLVYLSFSPIDAAFAERLTGDLEKRGFTIWNNENEKRESGERRELLRKAFEVVHAFIFIASPEALQIATEREKLEIAEVARCPIRVLWRGGRRRRDAIPRNQTTVRLVDMIDAHDDERYETALEELIAALSLLPSKTHSSGSVLLERTLAEPRNPYKGLRAFQVEEKNDFFGRDQLIDEMIDELERILVPIEDEHARLLAVIGPSGSGKSSLVMAGLVPLLQKGELSGSRDWIYLQPIEPGMDPIEGLTVALSRHLPERGSDTIRQDLLSDTGALHMLTSCIAGQPGRKVVLVVDQFEELFTQSIDEQIRKHFIDLIVEASTEPRGGTLVLLTLRADFYDKPMYYTRLAKILEKQSKSVLPMSVRELQAAIEQPALLPDVQLTLEENLVNTLLLDVQGQIGSLPMLQFTLDQLFQQRHERQLMLSTYEMIGKVGGALMGYAELVYYELSEDEKEQARRVFLQMVQPGDGVADTCRIATRAELGEEQWALIQQLTNKRLVVTNTRLDGQETAEIIHEALIQNWERLQTWMSTSRGFRSWQERLRSAMYGWEANNQDDGALLRGAPLAEAKRWLSERSQELTRKERTYLFHCILYEGLDVQEWMPLYGSVEETLHFLHTYADDSSDEKRLRCIDALTWLPHTSLDDEIDSRLQRFVLADSSRSVRNYAALALCKRSQVSSLTNLLAKKKYSKQEMQRLIQATASVRNVPEIGAQVQATLPQAKRRVGLAAVQGIISNYRGQFAIVTLIPFLIGQLLFQMFTQIERIVFFFLPEYYLTSDNFALNIVGSIALGLYIYIRTTVIDQKAITLRKIVIAAVIFNAFLSVLSCFYSLASYFAIIHFFHSRTQATDIASIIIVESSDLTIMLAVLFYLPKFFSSHLATRKLFTIASSLSLIQFAIAAGIVNPALIIAIQLPLVFTRHANSSIYEFIMMNVYNTFFSDTSVILSFGSFFFLAMHTCVIFGCFLGFRWGIRWAFPQIFTAKEQKPKRQGILSFLQSSSFTQGPATNLATLLQPDASMALWNPNTLFLGKYSSLYGTMPSTMNTRAQNVASVQQSRKTTVRRYILTTISILILTVLVTSLLSWTVQHPPYYIYHGHHQSVYAVVWSPDGKRIASASNDGTVQVWDAVDGGHQATYHSWLNNTVYAVAWSHNGKLIAAAYRDGTVQIWDAYNGKQIYVYRGHKDTVYSLDWSHDDKRIVSGGRDDTAQIWDAATGKHVYVYHGHQDVVLSVAWSHDDKHIVSGGADTTVQVWDATTGKHVYVYHGHQKTVWAVAWSPDSTRIVSVSDDHTVQVWDASTGDNLYLYPIMTYVNAIAWSPDGTHIATANDDSTVQVWRVA